MHGRLNLASCSLRLREVLCTWCQGTCCVMDVLITLTARRACGCVLQVAHCLKLCAGVAILYVVRG
jgi:hypothetical protein